MTDDRAHVGASWESALNGLIIRDGVIREVIDAGVREDWFQDSFERDVFGLALRHWQEHGKAPSARKVVENYPVYRVLRVDDPLSSVLEEALHGRKQFVLAAALYEAQAILDDGDPDGAALRFREAQHQLDKEMSQGRDRELVADIDDRIVRYRELAEVGDEVIGIATGFPTIDKATGGLQNGQYTTLVSTAKGGKAQPVDTPVLTPEGWVRMGDLTPGDFVIGRDGRSTTVVAVHERGVRPVYRVTTDDGASTRACAEHLWTVRDAQGKERTIDTTQLAGAPERTYLPVTAPVEVRSRHLPIDPYVLGLLIGDGGFTGGTPVLSAADDRVVQEVARRLEDGRGVGLVERRAGVWALTHGRKGRRNWVKQALQSLGLWGLKSLDKHLPDEVMVAPVHERLEVLQGLMDADGSVEGNKAVFNSSSPRLVEGVVDLVRSLGGVATQPRWRVTQYRDAGGELRDGRPSARLCVRLPEGFDPFRPGSTRWERWSGRGTKRRPPTRRVVSVEPAGAEQVRCITVANEDGLYVTEDYIVTHNSFILLAAAMAAHAAGERPLFLTYEMTTLEQAERHDAMLAGVSHTALTRGTLTPTEWDQLVDTLDDFRARQTFHIPDMSDAGIRTVSGIRAKIEKYDPTCVFIDGMYFIEPERTKEPAGSPQALTEVSRDLRQLNLSTNLPFFATTQALEHKTSNRKGRRITGGSIGYTSAYLQDASVILGLEEEDPDDDTNNYRLLRVIESRHSPRVTAVIECDWAHMRFTEVDREQAGNDLSVSDDEAPGRRMTARREGPKRKTRLQKRQEAEIGAY